MNTPTTAMIFAAGYGKRMRPLTDDKPKPMVEVCGKPLIDYRLDKLVEAGMSRVIVNTHYKAEILENYLRQRQDIEIIISYEETLLETGGGLVHALPHLGDEPFFLINGDVIWLDDGTPALQRLAEQWQDGMNELLLLQPKETAIGYVGKGDFTLTPQHQLQWPETEQSAPYVFTGISLFHPRQLSSYQAEPFSRSVLWRAATQDDSTIQGIYGLAHQGQWLHIDSPEGVTRAETYMNENTVEAVATRRA